MWKLVSIIALTIWFIMALGAGDREFAEANGSEFVRIDDIFDEANIAEVSKKSSNGCNSTNHDHPAGSFQLNMHNNTVCYWNITTPSNVSQTVSLYFMYLFLHPDDVITVHETYSDAVSNESLLNAPIHAQNGSFIVITEKKTVNIKYVGKSKNFNRNFEVLYNHGCLFAVAPDVKIIKSPIYQINATKSDSCTYRFDEIQHERVKQVLTFEEFNVIDSQVSLDGSSLNGEYKNDNPEDIFIDLKQPPMMLKADMNFNSSDFFKVKAHLVDLSCSGKWELSDDNPVKVLRSPPEELNNGTIIAECRWLIKHDIKSKVLGLKFDKLNFNSVFDIIAVNDGLSELSPPLLQVTTSNKNFTNQIIRSSGNYMWVSFKPLTYASSFSANVTAHGQGGYFKNSGSIRMQSTIGDDTVFLLEVNNGKVVILNFVDSSFSYPATLSVYDGFDTSYLLTSLHGQVKYPVVSRSSRMMVIATKFNGASAFSANFNGTDSGCLHMSTLTSESYVLPQKCNSTCQWIVSPQDTVNSVLLLALQYISLRPNDNVTIHRLDDKLTQLGFITANKTYVPRLSLPANVGALVKVVQGNCTKQEDKIILIGHSSYMPACNSTIKPEAPEKFQISSPLYPDTYPLFSTCYWSVLASEAQLVHATFQDLKLAENHCVKIIQTSSKTNMTYIGESLPDDLFIRGDFSVEFDSSNCGKKEVGQTLNNDVGFVLNVTVADCGEVLNKKSGEFNTSMGKDKHMCIWKITVPPTDKDSVNIITYSVTKKDDLKNYELHVYDGSSKRDKEIVNGSNSEIWSRTNTLIFMYERLNVSESSSVLVFNYNTLSCNSSMQCENKICMHPDWRCNGYDDCGDFSDERNCQSVPVSPDLHAGYSGVTLGVVIFVMLIIGLGLGLGVPVCIQKYKDSRYTRFRELSGIDG